MVAEAPVVVVVAVMVGWIFFILYLYICYAAYTEMYTRHGIMPPLTFLKVLYIIIFDYDTIFPSKYKTFIKVYFTRIYDFKLN